MPIFGLVWVASWVGCFFSSSQDLLQAPSHPSCVLPEPALRASSPRKPASAPVKTTLDIAASRSMQASSVPATEKSADQTPGFSASSLLGIFPLAQAVTAQAVWLPVSHTAAATGANSTSESLLRAFKHFFQVAPIPAKSDRPADPPADPPVVVTQVTASQSSAPVPGSASRGVGFGQCLPLPPNGEDAATEGTQRFQVKFKNSVVGEFSTRQQAVQVAHRLERRLNNPTLKAAEIQPVLVKGVPAVKWDDRILFTLSKELTPGFTCNSEILAIQWANNLRLGLQEPALTIAEAQEKMHGLETTSQTIDGMASWYGPYFDGRQTATGETFDETEFTAAHPSLPFDTYLKVTNLTNGKSVIVRVNDRGPYFDNRALDLSREAARSLDSEETGVIPIEAVIMKPAPAPTTTATTLAKL